jgi:hypothetical protein
LSQGKFTQLRRLFHKELVDRGILSVSKDGVPSNADKDSPKSVAIAKRIIEKIGHKPKTAKRLPGQQAGNEFEVICHKFLERAFPQVLHLRPGDWGIEHVRSRSTLEIARFEQYAHLIQLHDLAKENPALQAALGSDYTITPDLIIFRRPETDKAINVREHLVDEETASFASLRKRNQTNPRLHASISCKWTIRSDRAQNSRTEALNLVRNRKGRLPHIMVLAGEPLPSRLSSIALGTGDIDCVYHFALPELQSAVQELEDEEAGNILRIMVDGKRLRDVSDLPLDLAI